MRLIRIKLGIYRSLFSLKQVSNLQHRLNGYSEEEPSRVNNLKKIISFDLQKNVFVTNIIFSWKPEVLYISWDLYFCPPPFRSYFFPKKNCFLKPAQTSKKFAAAGGGGAGGRAPLGKERKILDLSSIMERFGALKRSTSRSPLSFSLTFLILFF